ncbi:O-antigen polymerase [Candidatus Magnetoovum chiemensis]|nr:O-antigen polymerase [Candidatus Magnetoovum chiemensis]
MNRSVRFFLAMLAACFLLFNIIYKFTPILRCIGDDFIIYVFWTFYILGFLSGIYTVVFPNRLSILFLIIGISFIFFGFRPYDYQTQIFDFMLATLSMSLLIVNYRYHSSARLNKTIITLLTAFVLVSILSSYRIILDVIRDASSLREFLRNSFDPKADTIFYTVSQINRLVIVFILTINLAMLEKAHENYKHFFVGLYIGAFIASFIGTLDYYGLISLSLFKDNLLAEGVLSSLFLNRGWFSQFVTIVVPFVLIWFFSKSKMRKALRMTAFFAIITCEIALILSQARAGWVTYPFVLLLCWMFVYLFDSSDDMQQLRKVNLAAALKIVLSVPITIIVSFVVIFNILGPLKSYLTDRGVIAGSVDPRGDITRRVNKLFDPNSRKDVWYEGFLLGTTSPVFGLGYESFAWQMQAVSEKSKDSAKPILQSYRPLDTPHNMYIEMFVSSGVIGLSVWVWLIIYVIRTLIVDLIANKRFMNISVIMSIVCFHVYNIFQDFAYICSVMTVIFLCLSYSMTISNNRQYIEC